MLYVTGHKDPATKRNIVLWEDIQIPFKGATYIRQGAMVVPFLKGHGLKMYVQEADLWLFLSCSVFVCLQTYLYSSRDLTLASFDVF